MCFPIFVETPSLSAADGTTLHEKRILTGAKAMHHSFRAGAGQVLEYCTAGVIRRCLSLVALVPSRYRTQRTQVQCGQNLRLEQG